MPPDKEEAAENMDNFSKKRKRVNLTPLSPQLRNTNRYTLLSNPIDKQVENENTKVDTGNIHSEIRKIPPIFVHNIIFYKQFHLSLVTIVQDDISEKEFTKIKIKNNRRLLL